MWEYRHTVTVPAGIKKVWDVLIDAEKWSLWDKDVKHAYLYSPFQVNAKGTLIAIDGSESVFYITEIEEYCYYCNFYELAGGTKLHFKHHIEAVDSSTSKVTFSYLFTGILSNHYRKKMNREIQNVMNKAMNNLICYTGA